jgi:hypothetical protein
MPALVFSELSCSIIVAIERGGIDGAHIKAIKKLAEEK